MLGTNAKLKQRALEHILILSDGSEEVERPTISLPSETVTPTYRPIPEDDQNHTDYNPLPLDRAIDSSNNDFDDMHAEIEGFLKDSK